MRLINVAGNLLLAVASVAATLAALEAAARVERHFRGGGKEDDALLQYTEPDPLLGWRKRPGAVAHYRRREYSTDVEVNAAGLRDRPRTLQAAPGTFRILLLGDSFVEGYTVDFEDTVGQVLETSLTRGACPVEVINGGCTGYSTDQEFLFYTSDGYRYSPDVVVLFFYGNDVVPNGKRRYYTRNKPLLEVRDGVLVPVNVPVRAPGAQRRERTGTADQEADQQEDEPEGSAAFEWLRERLMRGAPRAYDRLAKLGLWRRVGREEPKDERQVFRREAPPSVKAAWQKTARILEALNDAVHEGGARLLIAYVPNRIEVMDRDWELSQITYSMTDDEWSRDAVYDRLARITRKRRLPLLDLRGALRAELGLVSSPYFMYDGHWNALGHRTAAHAVGAELARRRWLPGCASP